MAPVGDPPLIIPPPDVNDREDHVLTDRPDHNRTELQRAADAPTPAEEAAEARADNAPVQEFLAWLLEFRRGATHEELTKALHEAGKRIETVGGKATVTLQLTLQADKKIPHFVHVTDKITTKLPEWPRHGDGFFVNAKTGDLSRHPDRTEVLFDARDVEGGGRR